MTPISELTPADIYNSKERTGEGYFTYSDRVRFLAIKAEEGCATAEEITEIRSAVAIKYGLEELAGNLIANQM